MGEASMSALRDKYAIVGTGKSRLGQVGANSLALLEEAIKNALAEAGLTNKDVDGLVVRGPDDVYAHHQLAAARLGIDASFSTSLDNGGASQILSIILAVMAIEAGLATTVVCGYGRDSWSRTHAKGGTGIANNDLIPAAQRPREHGPEFGHFGAVSQHAFGARRHMHEYGTTRNDFAAIATAFREHALRNPEAADEKADDDRGLLQGAADRRSVRHVRLQPEQRRRRRSGGDLDRSGRGRSSRSPC